MMKKKVFANFFFHIIFLFCKKEKKSEVYFEYKYHLYVRLGSLQKKNRFTSIITLVDRLLVVIDY